MGEIKISYSCIDDAITEIDQQLTKIQEIKSDIALLPFYGSKTCTASSVGSAASTGLCAEAVAIITDEKLSALATAIEDLFSQTKTFLKKAKIEYKDMDTAISKGY